jgi:hypothetical protein
MFTPRTFHGREWLSELRKLRPHIATEDCAKLVPRTRADVTYCIRKAANDEEQRRGGRGMELNFDS